MTKDEIGDMIAALPEGLEPDELIYRLVNWAVDKEREKVAKWMIQQGYATGHGDTVEDLLKELEWQVAEREREACAKLCDHWPYGRDDVWSLGQAIRARGER